MISILLALIGIFPVSFLVFSLSERLIAKHESRVGKQIAYSDFLYQTWIDARSELKSAFKRGMWIIYLLQVSIIFVFDLDVEYLSFIYLALNGYILVHFSKQKQDVFDRVEADRIQVRYAIATAVAMLCVFGSFTPSASTSLAEIQWNPLQLFFLIPFQFAGMILFGEHPFQGMSERLGWIDSAKFYVWSLFAAKLFLGGNLFFFDFHLKAALIYLCCRMVGMYFPRFYHKDLLRISILYLFPVTGVLWLFSMLIFGMMGMGAGHV